jgi:exopolysaccharide biosynthesis polyprenyl glycosylphosphotransferase
MTNQSQPLRYHWRTIFSVITLAIDALSIATCGFVVQTLLHKYYTGPVMAMGEALLLPVYFTTIWLVFSLLLGVYRHAYFTNSSFHILLASKAYVYASAITLASIIFFQITEIPRSLLALFLLLLPPFFVLGRTIIKGLNLIFMHFGLGIRNVLMVMQSQNGNNNSLPFSESLFSSFGYEIKGIVNGQSSDSDMEGEDTTDIERIAMLDLADYLGENQIDNIFISSDQLITNGFDQLIKLCQKYKIKLKLISPSALGVLRMARVFDIAGITLYAPPYNTIIDLKAITKRTFDIIVSTLLIVILSPVLLLTSLAIYLESRGSIIYGQERDTLKNHHQFRFFKFRSMVPNADNIRDNYSHRNESDGGLFKMKDDPRVTRVGKYIRKFSIDELPQLFNVLKGDMSLVGPRPLPIEDFDRANLSPEFWDAIVQRSYVKPGITGLWQISGRSNIDFHDMIFLDLYYVEYQSILFDLEILFETIPAVMISRGAY